MNTATKIHESRPLLDPRAVRRRLGWSQIRVAVMAGVGVGSVRLYEVAPDAIVDRRVRTSLRAVYTRMREQAVAAL